MVWLSDTGLFHLYIGLLEISSKNCEKKKIGGAGKILTETMLIWFIHRYLEEVGFAWWVTGEEFEARHTLGGFFSTKNSLEQYPL